MHALALLAGLEPHKLFRPFTLLCPSESFDRRDVDSCGGTRIRQGNTNPRPVQVVGILSDDAQTGIIVSDFSSKRKSSTADRKHRHRRGAGGLHSTERIVH